MPISDCEVRDPRIRRTRQLLQGALRDLLQSRSFEESMVAQGSFATQRIALWHMP